jgi:sec-independent protein translocase protein TatB
MFEVGFTEIVLILGLALLVLGPEKLPALAEKVGRWTGRARAMARQLRTQLEHEVTLEELARSKPVHTSSTSNPSSAESDLPPEPTNAAPPPNASDVTATPRPPEHANTDSDTTKAAQ